MRRSKPIILFLAKVVLFSFAIGALTTLVYAPEPVLFVHILVGGLTGALIGAGCLTLEITVLSKRSVRWLRTVPAIVIVLLRGAGYSLVIAFSLIAPPWFLLAEAMWQEPGFTWNFWFSVAIAFGISTSIELFQLLGKEASLALFTGRYRQPRLEERIVMFADLIGSTALAEELGELRFHDLLCDVAYDLGTPISAARGEVHRYVGDAIIITWPMRNPRNFERALTCAQEMVRALSDTAQTYNAQYGQTMRIRIALHCGPVAAGEIGTWKKEIALLGDTMNSAARIEGAARDLGAEIVISDTLHQHLPQEARTRLTALPDYTAHGKHDALRLWSVESDRQAT